MRACFVCYVQVVPVGVLVTGSEGFTQALSDKLIVCVPVYRSA